MDMFIYSDDISEADTPPPEQANASESSPESPSGSGHDGPSGSPSGSGHAGPSGRPSTPPPVAGPSNHPFTPPRRLSPVSPRPWQFPMCGPRPRVPSGVPPLPVEVAAEVSVEVPRAPAPAPVPRPPVPGWYIPRPRPPAPVVPAPPPANYSFDSIAQLKAMLRDRESFVIFSYHGQCFPGIINRKHENCVRIKKMKLVVNSADEPYTARWEFPSARDTWLSSVLINYEDIKHVIPRPGRVGINRRTGQSQYIVPLVDQYWMVNLLPPLRVRVRVVADIEQ